MSGAEEGNGLTHNKKKVRTQNGGAQHADHIGHGILDVSSVSMRIAPKPTYENMMAHPTIAARILNRVSP